jgi:hypothetical protein
VSNVRRRVGCAGRANDSAGDAAALVRYGRVTGADDSGRAATDVRRGRVTRAGDTSATATATAMAAHRSGRVTLAGDTASTADVVERCRLALGGWAGQRAAG